MGVSIRVFELVNLPVDADVPVKVKDLITTRSVPRSLVGAEYRMLDRAQLMPVDPTGTLVAFGSSGLYGKVCLDSRNLAVVHVPDEAGNMRNAVNVDLNKFIECVRAVTELFPFYDEDAESGEWERAADDLREVISVIDETALVHHSFWETFLDDVRIGDYVDGLIRGDGDQ